MSTCSVRAANPGEFDGLDVELAGDLLTMTEVAAILSEVTGREIAAPVLTPQQAVERGLLPAMVNTVERINENGSPARPDIARALGLPTTDFRTWARRTFSGQSPGHDVVARASDRVATMRWRRTGYRIGRETLHAAPAQTTSL
ncbi:hypothetical protein ACLQ29_31935 [Micromonospora sp. DT228]|uniref:hypothetical protein n=1 Tax=Micromonospora sp. DT228 TaxID=3393443 RepID=UPI003CF251E8